MMEEYISGTNQRVWVHPKENCRGEHCVIHSPSDHHMKSWPTHWRGDRGIMERICKHGVGHPDPDDLAFRVANGEDELTGALHGCCGCCIEKEE